MKHKDMSRPENTVIEVCVESLQEAVRAEKNGADQLELCSHLELDGLTPSFILAEQIVDRVNIPVKLMVRSRPGNFIYSKEEIKDMRHSIEKLASLPVAGFVIGALNEKDLPDQEALEIWSDAAGGTPLCFHKAIDLTTDWRNALEIIAENPGIQSLLTSGLKKSALEGIDTLRAMHENFGQRFTIIAAGSITPKVLMKMSDRWGGRYYHGRNILNDSA